MTVANTVVKNTYTLSGVTTEFSYTFAISPDDGSDIHSCLAYARYRQTWRWQAASQWMLLRPQ